VVSNGELLSQTPSEDGTRTTWVWNQQEQQASELSFFSIGRYDIYHSEITLASGRTIPEWTFIDPALSTANQTTTLGTRAQLKQMLDFFESKYGPYPGNSTGLVTDNTTGINYALETQDRPFFPNSASRGTTYHEIMHMWFGDNVSPFDWNDIWLNEGPATFSETQFPYDGAGSTTTLPETTIYNAFSSSSTGSALWQTPVAAMTNAEDLFGSPTYTRGNYTLFALRTAIGADKFATLMNTWQTSYGGTSKRTADFIDLAEDISGKDLTAFFNTWVYTTGKPAWPVRYSYNVTGPTTQVNTGDPGTFTLSVRNTGKVAMAAGAAVISVDVSALTNNATLGTLPVNVTQSGDTLTWSVPATALGATSSVDIPVTATGGSGSTLKAVVSTGSTVLGGTCVDCSASIRIGAAPISVTPAPTIDGLSGAGAPVVGQTLTANTADWDSGTTFTYQWYLDGAPVPGATSATYTPTVDVVGYTMTVKVIGTQAGRNPVSVTSAATTVGVRATQMTGTLPTIAGTPKIGGSQLVVDPGTWEPGTVFTYQWRANGTNISGATGPRYIPAVASQAGQTLDVVVTGTKAGYTTATKTSAATDAVAAGDALATSPTPELLGTPKVGTAYTPSYGYWDDGVVLTYQWKANGTNVSSGGTSAAIAPTAAMLAQTLTVTVTGTKPGITPVVVTSAASTPVVSGTQVLQPTPTVTGTPRASSASTGVAGSWDSGTTRTYRWLVDGTAVEGATGTTYTPTLAEIGKALTFEVTSTRTGYDTVVKTSDPKTIVGLAPTLTPTPTISGEPKVDVELTAEAGTWDDGTTLTYQWKADGEAVEGATGPTYTPGPGKLGTVITVAVTGSKPDYETVTKTSDPTAPVVAGDLTSTPVPTITGTPKVDVELTAVPGSWDEGAELAYQWLADGEAVEGATDPTYTPGPGKLGDTITVTVTGTKVGYETVSRTSEATEPVVAGDLTSTPVPTITGTPKVDVTLTAVPGSWDEGTELAYQWLTDGNPVDGATGTTYTPGAGKLGAVVTVKVTGTRAGYDPVTRTSEATSAVVAGDLTSTPVPTITGTPRVAAQLTAVPGTWDSGSSLAYQWLANGTAIDGATSATFTPTGAQYGAAITVKVTGTKAGYTTVSRTSAATAAVAAADLSSTPVPTITGTPKVGVQLTAVPGTWDSGTTLTYQWRADGEVIGGATGSTFTPGAGVFGAAITVTVTGTKTGYTTVSRTSAATAAVAPGDLGATPVPLVTGTPKVDSELTAVTGTWDSGTTLTYQWLVGGDPVDGATSATYVVEPGDAGLAVTVAVTGTKTGYAAVTKTSNPTAAVAKGDLDSTPAPTISGTAQVGGTLTAEPGTWDDGVVLTYAWFIGEDAIEGATGATYDLGVAELGESLRVEVTGTKSGYTAVTESSEDTAAVAPGVQTLTPTPAVLGSAKVGTVLQAVTGTWGDGVTLSYTWLRNGTPIPGATKGTYTLVAGDLGAKVTVQVTGVVTGYEPATTESLPTNAVARGTLAAHPAPVVQGLAKVGRTLKVRAVKWESGVKLTYKWYAGSKAIGGGTKAQLKVTKAMIGKQVHVVVTATKAGYTTVVKSSKKTAKVKP
jgi:hypothetical protein